MKHLKEILNLPDSEKFHLVEIIWDSIAIEKKQSAPLSQDQINDLMKRNVDFEKNPTSGISWAIAKEKIRNGKWRAK